MNKPHSLNVDLGERSYPIIIGEGLLSGDFDLQSYVTGADCVIVSNTTISPLYVERVAALLPDKAVSVVELEDGEEFKTIIAVQTIIDHLVATHASRDTTIIAVGGGVVGDISGFAASCYMRGVPFIQIPTTLLAQVDSSVGGKTGVNHPGGKNLIGAFHQPVLVLIDTDTLKTLPERELKAGLAEVIKHGAMADADYFGWLEQHMAALVVGDAALLAKAILRSCEIKAAVVSADEREAGKRALLNFGHTFGHAIENCLGYGEWLHGEAVAAGMLMAARLSELPETDQARLADLIMAAGLPATPPAISADALQAAMSLDKKVAAKALRFVLLNCIGDARISSDYDAALLDDILHNVSATS